MAENDMEAIDIISRVATAATALRKLSGQDPESQNALMRGMLLRRELEGPSEREKFNFEQGKFAEQQRTEQVKYTLSKFSELAKEASPATKSVMMGHIESLWNVMSPIERTASKMIYDHSPMNPIEQKATYWDSTMKAPQVNADPSKDPYAYGIQVLNLDDYHQQRQNFLTGTPIHKRRIAEISAGVFAVRGENDKVSVMSSQDLALQQTADEHNTSPGALLANNGYVYGADREVMVGGVLSRVRNVYDALNRKAAPAEVTPTSGSIAGLEKNQQDLQDFLASWAGKDDSKKTQGSRVYVAAQKMLDQKASESEVFNFVKSIYPGWNFKIEGQGTQTLRSRIPLIGGLFEAYAEGEKERIIAWPGNATQVQTKNGAFVVYYDARMGKVYDPSGRIVSNSLDELRNYAATRTMDEIKKEAKGK